MLAAVGNQTELTPAQLKFFREKGFLVIRGAVPSHELAALQAETLSLIEEAPQKRSHPDYWFNDEMPSDWYKNYNGNQLPQDKTEVARGIPFRIEYPIEKGPHCRALAAHPLVLKAMEQLCGPSFVPTWDSLVFKALLRLTHFLLTPLSVPGQGVPIKWHRDASAASVDRVPAIDVGFYLDAATQADSTCLWAIPGSQTWPDELAAQMIDHLVAEGFRTSGAVPVEVGPGDVILHNILVLHGSQKSSPNAPLRRTVYFEYRAIEQELKMGPHVAEYIPLKQRVLQACIRERQLLNLDDAPFAYQPAEQFAVQPLPEDGVVPLRFPHKDYFRSDYKG